MSIIGFTMPDVCVLVNCSKMFGKSPEFTGKLFLDAESFLVTATDRRIAH